MTKAEEKALEAYPELLYGSCFGPLPVDLNKACREKYQEGYEAAKKDILNLLEDNIVLHLGHATVDNDTTATDGLIEAKELILTQL